MSKRIGITILFSLFLLTVSAQQKLNFVEVDKKSYELYQQKKWKGLIKFSSQARNDGIDFFYLQARTGIAYFNLKKYRKASKYFYRAWKNDQSFEWLQEYLYYSLIYSGRYTESSKVAANFTASLQAKINYSPGKITRVAAEGGYSFNPDFESLTDATHDEKAGVGSNYGEAFYLKNYHFESFDLSHQVSPGFIVTHNLTYLGINREERIDWGSHNTFPMKTNQLQYYINPTFVAGRKLYLSASASLIWGSYDLLQGGLNRNSLPYFFERTSNFGDYVFSASGWSHFGNISPGAEVNFANINNENLMQVSGWMTFYPFSNTNFYLTPRVWFKNSQTSNFGFNTFGISGGIQLGPVHFYGQYLNGDMENFIEPAGYVVANFPGTSSRKYSGSFYFPTGKKIQLVLRYINQDVTEKYNVYTNGIRNNSTEYSYIKHTLTGGISWNF
jgi:hypothetical protein